MPFALQHGPSQHLQWPAGRLRPPLHITNLGLPRQEVAFAQHHASPSGIAAKELRRPAQWVGPRREQRQIPARRCLVRCFQQCLIWGNSYQSLVPDQFPCQPQEGLLEVVIGLGRNIIVLEILFAVESDGFRLNLTLLDIDFVAGEDDWDVLANTDKVT